MKAALLLAATLSKWVYTRDGTELPPDVEQLINHERYVIVKPKTIFDKETNAVFATAGNRLGVSEDSTTLGELVLGAVGSARVRIWSRLAALVRVRVAWLPVGHQMTIGGGQVVEPGALDASISIGLVLGL